MEPLKALVRYQNVVSACSRCLSTSTNEYDDQGTLLPGSDINPVVHDADLRDRDKAPTTYLRTRYDIYVELDANATRVLEIALRPRDSQAMVDSQATTDPLSTAPASISYNSGMLTPPLTSPNIESKFRYRIRAEWQTSYLWHDPEWPGSPEESSVVDSEDIQNRYPQLHPYWDRWVDFCEIEYYDKAFGGVSPTHEYDPFVLVDHGHTVAWEVDGFLMACWLLQQPDVDSVVYVLHNIDYDINADNKEAEFERLLKDVVDRRIFSDQ